MGICVSSLYCSSIMEIEILYGKMIVEVLNMFCLFLRPFLSRELTTCLLWCLIWILKSMDQIGRNVAITLMQWYDDLVWLPFLNSHCFGFFESRWNSNPSSYNTWDTLHSTKLFGLMASSWEAINQVLFKVKVFLFYRFLICGECIWTQSIEMMN
jgi:hypothetical protein